MEFLGRVVWGGGQGKRSTDNTAGKYPSREDCLGKVSSDRKNLVSTTGLGKQDSRVQRMREPKPAAVMSSSQ